MPTIKLGGSGDQRFILAMLLGTAVVAFLAESAASVEKGSKASGGFESLPRVLIGGAVVFFVIGVIGESSPKIGRALATLIFVSTLFVRGEEAFDSIRRQVDKTPKTPKTAKRKKGAPVADKRSGR